MAKIILGELNINKGLFLIFDMEEFNLTEIIKIFEKIQKKQDACAKKGHLGEEVQMNSFYRGQYKTSCYCTECGAFYSRDSTGKEINDFNKTINEPFTYGSIS